MGIPLHVQLFLLSILLLMASHAYGGCDLYQGSWVWDSSYPLYDSSKCPFIEKQFDCLGNGRTDRWYLKFKWKPSNCELPRFDGRDFLKRLKGKTIMFVGDSLSLNQWQSLTCMLHISVPRAKYTLSRAGGISTFAFPDYGVKVVLVRNAFLVDMVDENGHTVLRLDTISSTKIWLNADVMIFNTWHWWLHHGRKQPWTYMTEGTHVYRDMNRLVAYEKALTTWAKWVDTHVNSPGKRVFFQGVSPDHNDPSGWHEMKTQNCSTKKIPLKGSSYPGGPHPAETVVKNVLRSMSKPVTLLDVTLLSQLRVDGHPSFHGMGGHRDMDCSHWCLAGVPDTWNQLLYAQL